MMKKTTLFLLVTFFSFLSSYYMIADLEIASPYVNDEFVTLTDEEPFKGGH